MYWNENISNQFVTGSERCVLMRGACGYVDGELYKKIEHETTTFVFGMKVVVILIVNFTR